MGAHYTGACMGMPYAAGALDLVRSLAVVAGFSLLGATLASHAVQHTVAFALVDARAMGVAPAIAVVASAFLLTTLFTYLKMPTSTIQILVFCVAGAATAAGAAVHWATVLRLAGVWVAAPLSATVLGFLLSRALVRHPVLGRAVEGAASAGRRGAGAGVAAFLIGVGVAVSFTMGANDVSNASGVLLMTGLMGTWGAAFTGGLGLALGALTWGRPLLSAVAYDIVRVDAGVAVAAQAVQALVVLVAVVFGYFTSLNQAMVGALAGAGLARGLETVHWRTVRGILAGWAVGPAAGFAVAYAGGRLVGALLR
ncbi:MAG: inorganic phosphate transporter [Clostridia bacterium]|nr:inorganic phosphate transporter [Clostridia bacterium]